MTQFDETTTRIYWEMMGKCFDHRMLVQSGKWKCTRCGGDNDHKLCPVPDPIPLSEGDLAFYMTDKIAAQNNTEMTTAWLRSLEDDEIYIVKSWLKITPTILIKAACAAWKGMK